MDKQEWLKEVRKAMIDKDLTWEKVSKDISYSKSHLYNVMSGKTSAIAVQRISEYLGLEVYTDEDDTTKQR